MRKPQTKMCIAEEIAEKGTELSGTAIDAPGGRITLKNFGVAAKRFTGKAKQRALS